MLQDLRSYPFEGTHTVQSSWSMRRFRWEDSPAILLWIIEARHYLHSVQRVWVQLARMHTGWKWQFYPTQAGDEPRSLVYMESMPWVIIIEVEWVRMASVSDIQEKCLMTVKMAGIPPTTFTIWAQWLTTISEFCKPRFATKTCIECLFIQNRRDERHDQIIHHEGNQRVVFCR